MDRDPFERLAEEFAERLRRGEHPSITEYIARCPERADDIRELFPEMAVVERIQAVGRRARRSVRPVVPPVAAGVPERLGDYRILRYLGEGGMGVVYEAVRESLRSHVALKVMHPQLRDREKYLRRFRTEARSAARLHHTNIVSVFDYGVHDGVCYYAMQYIAGHSLDKILGRRPADPLQETEASGRRRGCQAARPGQGPPTGHRGPANAATATRRFAAGPDVDGALTGSGPSHTVALGNSRRQGRPPGHDAGDGRRSRAIDGRGIRGVPTEALGTGGRAAPWTANDADPAAGMSEGMAGPRTALRVAPRRASRPRPVPRSPRSRTA